MLVLQPITRITKLITNISIELDKMLMVPMVPMVHNRAKSFSNSQGKAILWVDNFICKYNLLIIIHYWNGSFLFRKLGWEKWSWLSGRTINLFYYLFDNLIIICWRSLYPVPLAHHLNDLAIVCSAPYRPFLASWSYNQEMFQILSYFYIKR